MRPQKIKIAGDNLFGAPYATDPTKRDPTATDEAKGFPPNVAVSPQRLNWYLRVLADGLDEARSIQPGTFAPILSYAANPGTSACNGAAYDQSIDHYMVCYDGDGFAWQPSVVYSVGGEVWTGDIVFDGFAGHPLLPLNELVRDSETDNSGRRTITTAPTLDSIQTSNLVGTWVTATVVPGGLTWNSIGCDKNQAAAPMWIVGDAGTGTLYFSTDGLNYAPVAAPPAGS